MIDLVRRTASARTFLGKLWTLARPYWFTDDRTEVNLLGLRFGLPERWLARGLLLVILTLGFVTVWINKLLNGWNAEFFNAIQDKNEPDFWRLLISFDGIGLFFSSFTGLAFSYIVVAVYQYWLQQLLVIRWRRWLTEIYFRDWLSDRTYYRMELLNHGADNPEQRIQQDIAQFTSSTLVLSLDLIMTVATLITFMVILWTLSGSVLIAGVEIPGFMLWAAIVYAGLGSFLTWMIGRRLVRVSYALERYNADFRYRMTRVRENSESIALYGGEEDEKRRLSSAFRRVYDTFWESMQLNKRLIWLGSFYGQASVIFPFLIQADRYFSGAIPLGTLTQTAGAFGTVQNSLSWFVNNFSNLADWRATVNRLTGFAEAMAAAKAAQGQAAFDRSASTPNLGLTGVDVDLPDGKHLLRDVDLVVTPGEAVLLQGPSGSGKTTLFRVLAGLWPFGHGKLDLPQGARIFFLPQKPYLPIGTLAEVLAYPETPESYDPTAYREALDLSRLGHLADRLEESGNWSMSLSPGEQQRLAFARAFLFKPDWLFLDEATSALDEATEARLYELVREQLPGVTLVSIAHKPSVQRFHSRRIVIQPATGGVVSEALPEPAE